MTAADIAGALHGRRSGRGYIAPCPAHDDRSPSFTIVERDGRILVHCHAGCSQAEVMTALRLRGLWPERDRRPWTTVDRSRWIEEQRIRRDALYFADAARQMAEWALEVLSPTDTERAAYSALLVTLRVSPEGAYRAWLENSPVWAAALAQAGRARAKRLQIALARWIAADMPGVADGI